MYVWWFSPTVVSIYLLYAVTVLKCRGDSQGSKNYNSRSPLSEPGLLLANVGLDVLLRCRGDSQERRY